MQDETQTYTSGDLSIPPDLRLLHYNDVYHIDPSSAEPVGGVARFQTLCNHYRDDAAFNGQPKLVTLFSGDAFNPSLESSVTKGSHMVPFLNNIGTDVACVGNHDLDFGIQRFEDLAAKCLFPWLLANVIDPALGDDVPLGHAKKSVVITASNGIKIGVIGLVEKEWLDTINSLPPNLIFKSAAETAVELVPSLRAQGAEMIVAVTHQREPNDNKLAEQTPNGFIDIIVGGHDHFYQHKIINGTHILRSGTDFKQLSYIEARKIADSAKWDFHIVRRDLVSDIQEDPTTVKLTEKLTTTLKSKLEKPIGYTAVPLDARFTTVRVKESNMGNFVCDLMRSYYSGDCCIMAAGTVRGDQIYPPGLLRIKDIMNCFPFEDPCVVLGMTGQAVLGALENSVSTYPALEGRFPQVSNIKFEFDPEKAPHSRILWVKIGDEDLQLGKLYRVVTRDYMGRGKDGFTSMLYESDGGTAKEIVSEENGILISMLLRQYFMSLKILGRWRHWSPTLEHAWTEINQEVHEHHQKRVKPYHSKRRHPHSESTNGQRDTDDKPDDSDSDVPGMEEDDIDNSVRQEREKTLITKFARKWWRLSKLPGHPSLCNHQTEGELDIDWTRAISPQVQGRIIIKENGADGQVGGA